MENLYGYAFFYNPFKGVWCAVEREHQQDYYNGKLSENKILKNKDIQVLISFLSNPTAVISK